MSNDFENAIDKTGWGPCNYFVIGLCGMCSLAEVGASLIVLIVAPLLACDFKLNRSQATALNATSSFGMAIGGFLFGTMSDASSRKRSIPITMTIVFCGSIVLSFAQTSFLINFSIFLLGAGLAGNNVVLRVNLIECLPMKRRGTCLAILDLFWVIGHLSTLGIAWFVIPSVVKMNDRKFRPNSWRVLAGLGGMPSIMMTCLLSLLPPSPRHLLYRRKQEEALAILRQIYAINNSKHTDTYQISSLENCIQPEEEDDDYRSGLIITVRKSLIKTIDRIQEMYNPQYRWTSIFGMIICLLQFPGFIWLALWNSRLLYEMERERNDKQLGKNSTCIINTDDMAVGFLSNCQKVDMRHFELLLLLSLSYILGEILVCIKIDVIGRKKLLFFSGILGAVTSLSLIFIVHNIAQILLSFVFLTCYAIGRTATTTLLLENYPTRLRGTAIGFVRILPHLAESFTKFSLSVHCLPTVIAVSGFLMGTAIAGLPLTDLTQAPMKE